MMATSSMGPNFNAGHPAGMGHPGVAGHPVGPGMPHQPGQQGAPGGMPHQFAGGPMGVPPGAQANAMMAAMPPGMAAQFQNMAPAQQQAFMQQHQQQQQQQQQHQQHNMQQQFAQNPNFAAIRQQQMMAQHHQQQQARNMMAQQFNAGVQHQGMPIGQMQLTPQQIHALRQQRGQMPMGHPNMMLRPSSRRNSSRLSNNTNTNINMASSSNNLGSQAKQDR
ncbi:uncharacterized protein J7T54_005696 [Emericellopsis cladophorae]|uniref:Uncharacterized protein n=1 Tax=Emericellopsis cladophorae TaxID=2686198 RepID=A0A9Q0BFN5_9HYPO|nr:uncharacterized protein J7T54_005696 [Emericellopsis cladophorae]KAI6783667.1 hypothetical protein J7T54_005696 [Emericellopsis cladophorae]